MLLCKTNRAEVGTALLLLAVSGCMAQDASPAETDGVDTSGSNDATVGSDSVSDATPDDGSPDDGVADDDAGPDDNGSDAGSGGGSDTDSDDSDADTSADDGGTEGMDPVHADVRNYIFGHSLVFNAPDANVPIWLSAIATEAGYSYGMSGQYGFASTHAAELPPDPNWGIEGVTSVWDGDSGQSFSDVEFNTVLFTEGNFFQYLPPTESEPGAMSSVDNTLAVFDWVAEAQPDVRYVVYENWPDMAAFTDAKFGGQYPSDEEVAAYHDYTQGDFHQWWVDYREALAQARPELDIVMVPVGSVLAELLTTTLSDIPVEDLYLDNAPHGTPTLYFLAGVITYMGMYGNPPPASYVPPESIHPVVLQRYEQIVDVAWGALP